MSPRDTCVDPFVAPLASREIASYARAHGGHTRRQTTTTVTLTQGYVTTDAFGTDGDDTAREPLGDYDYPHFFQALGGFPADGSLPDVVDLIFTDYIQPSVLQYLATVTKPDGTAYGEADVAFYIDETFSTRMYLPLYVQTAPEFQANADNCTIY